MHRTEGGPVVAASSVDARHSCRAFLDTEVPADVVTRILEEAQGAPSWCNAQPWRTYVTGPNATGRLSAILMQDDSMAPDFPFPERYDGALGERRRESGLALYDAVGIERGDRAASARQALENFRFFGAPHVAIVTVPDSLGPYALVDAGIYVDSFLNAAHSAGVATCPQAAVALRSPALRKFFDMDDDRRIVCGIAFGWADEHHPANSFRTGRADLSETVVVVP